MRGMSAMPRRARGTRAGLSGLACLALGVSLAATASLGGCGVVDRVMANPTITAVPSQPDEITPTVAVPGASGAPAAGTSTAGAPTAPTPRSTPAPAKRPEPGGIEPTERLVVVDSLGIGFAAPTLFMEIDPEKYFKDSAALDELAKGMGISPDSLRNGVLNQVDRMVVGRADDGRTASIIVARLPLDALPTDAAIRREITGMLGGTVTAVKRVATAAGPVVRADYRVGPSKFRQYGEQQYLETPDGAIASVTVTAFSAAESQRMGARVLKTLRTFE